MEMWGSVVAVGLSYLLGSVSFAVVVSRAMGLADPRSYGSGNPGATNVLRSGNKPRPSSRCSAMRPRAGSRCSS